MLQPDTISSLPSMVPTVQYNVALDQIRYHSDLVAFDIQKVINDKKIDPANLVVMVAEEHLQVSQALYEIWMGKSLVSSYPDLTVCDERAVEEMENYKKISKVTEGNLARRLQRAKNHPSYDIVAYGSSAYGINYRAIDVNAVEQEDYDYDMIVSDLPVGLIKSLSGNEFFYGVFRKYREIYRQEWALETLECEGMVLRDLFMMDKIQTAQKESGSPILTINGQRHLADVVDSNRPTLLQMLLELGKDVVTVTVSEDSAGISRAQLALLDQMSDIQRLRYHQHYNLEMPDYNDWTQMGISNLQKMQIVS